MVVYEDAPVPALRPGDALVRVHAAAISPAEFTWRIYETPDGRSRLPTIPSHEVSGVVAAVAPDVRDVQVGDAIYGLSDFFRGGAAAEYVAVRAAELAPKPRSLDHASAAATPLSALTAWQAPFHHGRLAPGQRVLIHGAAGGVGSFAVQLARWRGAHVIGTDAARNVDFVRKLGADEFIDFRTTRFETVVRDLDVVLDHRRRHDDGAVLVRPGAQRVTLVRPASPQWTAGCATTPKGSWSSRWRATTTTEACPGRAVRRRYPVTPLSRVARPLSVRNGGHARCKNPTKRELSCPPPPSSKAPAC